LFAHLTSCDCTRDHRPQRHDEGAENTEERKHGVLISITLVPVPTGVAVLDLIGLLFFLSSLLGGLLGPTPRYELTNPNDLPANDSDRFLEILEALTDAQLNRTGS
jgi:hypothetical protein